VNDLIEITIGARPWLPSDDAESVAEFDRYDFPTCGLIRQGDGLFVFDCVEGHLMEGNVWMYARVSADEAEVLQRAAGEDLERALDAAFHGRRIMGVLAIGGRVRSGTPVAEKDIAEKGSEQALLDELRKGRDVATDTADVLKQLVDV
jgi:hypothetical protein